MRSSRTSTGIVSNPHYQAILRFYENRRAERSQVPLIAHIDEGLRVLEALSASQRAMDAFCQHPMVQNTESLEQSLQPDSVLLSFPVEAAALMLAMEWRTRTFQSTAQARTIRLL
jgi:hypothetical protein